jgi:hypothetical protein
MSSDTGLCYCHKCSWSGNALTYVKQYTGQPVAAILTILESHGVAQRNDTGAPRKTTQLQLASDGHREMTLDERDRFCEVKQIDHRAFAVLGAMMHAGGKIVLIPAYDPTAPGSPCGWIRANIDGTDVALADGRTERYPQVAGSRHGLLGLPWLLKKNPSTVCLCEGWRDMLAVLSVGHAAVASSGGASTFKDEWIEFFRGKSVPIIMDSDSAGIRAARRAKEKLTPVCKCGILFLPYEMVDSHGKDMHDYLVADLILERNRT